MSDSRKRIADAAFLLALMLYVLAGVTFAPVHGDEYMQMSMAHDDAYIVSGQWARLAYTPPLQPDTEQYLRLINGTINKYLIGLAWYLDGRSAQSLPGIYAWALPLDWNRQHGNVPDDSALHIARWPSALLTALGVIPVFILGWHLRLRSLAYPASLLYALHPVILLNGRRAMMEGSLMLASLLTMAWLVSMIVAEHSAASDGLIRRVPFAVRYAVLGILSGLAVAAKQTGIVVALAALAAALLAGIARDRSWRPWAWVAFAALCGSITWLVLNPAYWNDPIGVAKASLSARADLLASQQDGTLTYTDPWQRVEAIVKQPFLTPPQYYESNTWAGLIDNQVAAYSSSSIDGWDWGPFVGWALTLLGGFGLVTLVWDALHRDLIAWAILIWTGATILASLAIPLAWQRYYLPLLLTAIILAAAGLGRLVVRRVPEEAHAPIASDVSTA